MALPPALPTTLPPALPPALSTALSAAPLTSPPLAPSAADLPTALPAALATELPAAIPGLILLNRGLLPTVLPSVLPTALSTPLPAPIPSSHEDASTSDDEPLSVMAKRVRRTKAQSCTASMTAVIVSPTLLKSDNDHNSLKLPSVSTTTQIEADVNSSDEEPLCTSVRRIETATGKSAKDSLVPIVQTGMTESTKDTLRDTLTPSIAPLGRGTESPTAPSSDHGLLLEVERAPKRLKLSKVALTQLVAESNTLTTASSKSTFTNVINDEEVGVIVKEAIAELRQAETYRKAGQEAKVLKLVNMVNRFFSHDGTYALRRLLPLDDDWANTKAWKFQQDHRNAASRLEQLLVAYYTFRDADEALPFGSCLKNMALITLFREHEKVVAEVRTPERNEARSRCYVQRAYFESTCWQAECICDTKDKTP